MSKVQRPWPLVGCSLVACILIALVYLLQLTPTPPGPLDVPEHHPNDERVTRPRIELHPEDHIYRTPVTQHLSWRVTSEYRRPDGVLKRVCLVNGLFPGPTIEARSGDTLIITVANDLPEDSIALHWHGLSVTNDMDGAAGVSQSPIAPGKQFVYNMTITPDHSGTFWYHAHSGVSRADGLYGGLIVHAPASKATVRGLYPRALGEEASSYDKELLLLIGDWYHRSAKDVLDWYTDPGNFGNEPVPDSLLIHGVGRFACEMAVAARPVDCVAQSTNISFGSDPQRKLRIRVVNTGALVGFDLQFIHHRVDLLQIDSVDVKRPTDQTINSLGTLYPGQRMDFVLWPTQDTGHHSPMAVRLNQECFKYANPALTPNQSFSLHSKSPSMPTVATESTVKIHHLDIQEVPSAPSIIQAIPPTAQQTHVVYTKIQKMARHSNKPFGYFNQTTWRQQQDPPVPLTYLPRSKWDKNQLAISTGSTPTWIDFVINNLDEGSHPFHLHGHSFYILATHQSEYGWGSYNPFVDKVPPHLSSDSASVLQAGADSAGLNIDDPLTVPYDLSRAALRDTVQIPSRGYAVLRFRADNPGVWLLHCHILWHSVTGMAMLIDVQGNPAGLVAHNASPSR
ncbi:unnamed protein product [Penicillium salamii]|uniref:Uncharacterized protein n=1 Tax=Penicillium salamii TaxID=1612424 RepID=A0A9W4IYK7_9EURO|nr:unnamed protein product [Penicillium salamii]CAG8361274.1 unnamed protein product [Penicillium salamii]CAG8365490.1 unnamed protein product [Penicillium salamii]CAG8387487.1 unnamed protein product [Penicillium salamii]